MKFLKSKFVLIPLGILLLGLFIYNTVLAFRGEITIPSAITIGDLQFRVYGIILVISILVSAAVLEKLFKYAQDKNEKLKKVFEKFDIYEVLIWSIIPGIVFARIFYFLSNFENYDNLVDVIKIWEGGMSIFGAVIGGVVGILIYLKKSKIKTFPILDLIFITIPLGHAIGRWANFINQEVYGPPTNLPWKMYVAPINRVGIPSKYVSSDYFHPLFLYEFFLNLILFVVMIVIYKKGSRKFDGFFVAFYALGYGFIRFLMEFLRFDPKVQFGLSVAQYISLAMIVGGGGFLLYKSLKTKKNGKS